LKDRAAAADVSLAGGVAQETKGMTTQHELEMAQRLRVVSGRLSRRLRQTEAGDEAGLTPARVSALLNVDRHGSLRLAELAAAEGLNPTMLSRMVADLVEAGLLERFSDPDDRRSAWVSATAAGHRLAQQMRRQRTEAVETALAGLRPSERRAIDQALPALEALAELLPGSRPPARSAPVTRPPEARL
jgi:DNA-binding MarR family transcriptional regulator